MTTTSPRSAAIRALMASSAMRAAPPVVRDWLAGLLRSGEKAGRRAGTSGGEEATPLRQGSRGH
jgi:hypothetical protein